MAKKAMPKDNMNDFRESVQALLASGYSEESIRQFVTDSIKAAYKKTFGSNDNCIVSFEDDMSGYKVYSRKVILDGIYDPVTEIELEEALQLSSECEEGDEVDIEIDPKDFNRTAVSSGKQTMHQGLNENYKKTLLKEWEVKKGEVIIGYYQREHNGSIYVDLGKVEGVLPVKFQSPREVYAKNDKIKALIVDVKTTSSGVQIVLSRTDPKLVQNIVELEVPEIADNTIGIYKIVREAGYRTKIAVFSNKSDVDPVGACVGLKGQRIQNIIQELEGEKIDVLPYNSDAVEFIKNALSPAEVSRVLITDDEKRQALAIVPDTQFSLAIGKQGLNVRLANKLCDWSIDVKTEEQAAEMDLSEFTARKAAESLFANNDVTETVVEGIATLPGVDADAAAKLTAAGFGDIQKFVDSYEADTIDVEGVSADQLDEIYDIINKSVEFVEEDESAESTDSEVESSDASDEGDEEEYFCPECGAKITLDMTKCPSCGVEFEFAEE